MGKQKSVYTTGEIAKICNVAPRTVSKWFDSGQLRGYRIPGSRDRRVPLEMLVRFMRAHGIPLNGLEGAVIRVVVADGDAGFLDALRRSLPEEQAFDVRTAGSTFELGMMIGMFRPAVVLADVGMPGFDLAAFFDAFRFHADAPSCSAVALMPAGREADRQRLMDSGFAECLFKPFDAVQMLGAIRAALSNHDR